MSILSKINERPSFYVTLPSNLYFYDNIPSEELSILREVGTRPLSVIHQLSMKNPEKLFNGAIIEEMIHDCTTIKKIPARDLLKCDVDLLLLSIKLATTGPIENVRCACPFCKVEQDKQVSIEAMIANVKTHEQSYSLDLSVGIDENNDPIVARLYLRPSTFGEKLQLEQEIFKDSAELNKVYKEITAMSEEEIAEYGNSKQSEITKIVTQMTIDSLSIISKAVLRVVILDKNGVETLETETDHEAINNFIRGISTTNYNAFRQKMEEINGVGVSSLVPMKCSNKECQQDFNFIFEVNVVDFFGLDS